ncbi:hypothetical protein [Phenylobacterium aquaticum]|uniref:hypothetical protein n=1 Tax=Phenylobacterium aquaticum TaxID=1763816 RepID=UPI001F5E1714|nr:hypothetical protein [Phenylobacterium aquaticum]MCI3133134.1 hypothetical protein [Phenylobacterium aquaticum]
MRRSIALFATFAFMVSLASAADAATQCRDAKGKFIKCPASAASTAPSTKCRDIKTKKFAKCGAPGTEAVPAKPK